MKIIYFTHSVRSCWNHGNVHFVRGLLRALQSAGHQAVACEPETGWSVSNLLADHGASGLAAAMAGCDDLDVRTYRNAGEAAALCDGADLVLVHEWNEPTLVTALGRLRVRNGRFQLLFHDTHHRAVSDPDALRAFDLTGYDGVLAFGASLADVYRRMGWGRRAFVWHEAADITLFRPEELPRARSGAVWVGNFGDGERTAGLQSYLLEPCRQAGLALDVFGVRYPPEVLARLHAQGARYLGWLPNVAVPAAFARHLATVHVPRRAYVEALPGIPTIRVFEALACGIPLVCSPWQDIESLFRPGTDFLQAGTPAQMAAHLRALTYDTALRRSLAESGLRTIAARHTCAHRAAELLALSARLRADSAVECAA